MSEWISVTDQLPNIDRRVLLKLNGNKITLGILTHFGFYSNELGFNLHALNISHWMPLPNPPEVNDE